MVLLASACAWAQQPRYLENSRMRLSFDSKSGTLKTMENKLTAEIHGIFGDEWEVDAVEFHAKSADLKIVSSPGQTVRWEVPPTIEEKERRARQKTKGAT